MNRYIEKEGEAKVHFELYRHLMDCISSENKFGRISYVSVKPEVKAADLVVYAKVNSVTRPFIVIEVKKRTQDSLHVFNDDSVGQAKGYAEELSSTFYAVTDGSVLRLFKTPDLPVGDYQFSLDSSDSRKLLSELADLHAGILPQLSFSEVKPPIIAIQERSDRIVKILIQIFKEVSGDGSFTMTQHGKVYYLNVKNYKGVLRLDLSEKPNQASIDIRLNILREAVGARFVEVMKRLAKVPGFEWASDLESITQPNTWRYIRNLMIEESDLKGMKANLQRWLLDLEKMITDYE